MNADQANPQDESSAPDSPAPIPGVAGLRIYVTGHNRAARKRIEPMLSGATRPGEGPIDLAVITPETVDEWRYFATKALARLMENGQVFLVLDEGASRHVTAEEPVDWVEAARALGLACKNSCESSGSEVLTFVRGDSRDSAPE